jgi:hypothetical protein
MKHPETGVKTQLHIEILTFKSHLGQHNTTLHFEHLNLSGLFFAEHKPHHMCLPF